MAYIFSGCLIDITPASLPDVHTYLPHGVARWLPTDRGTVAVIADGVWPNHHPECWNPLDFPLRSWVQNHPQHTLVYLYVECHGGNCDQAGFVCRGGTVTIIEPLQEDAIDMDTPLVRLVRHIGIELKTPYFKPLEQGYFE